MQIGFMEYKSIYEKSNEKLKEIGVLTFYDGTDLNLFLNDLDVLFVKLGFDINKEFIKMCPRLKWICTPTTGHTHLDEYELKKNKIQIISLKNEKVFLQNIRATPEHTFGLIISLLRNYNSVFNINKKKDWDRDQYCGYELNNSNVAIIGMGRVGLSVAKYCEAFGAKIGWYDDKKIRPKKNWVKYDNIHDLLKWGKIIILCANHEKKIGEIIGKFEINLMKKKFFINTARGELVNENDLINAIEKDSFLGVALDVICKKKKKNKLEIFLKLKKSKNLILTPHIGGMTYESRKKTDIFIVDKFIKNITKANNNFIR